MEIINKGVRELAPMQTIAITHFGDYAGIGNAFEQLAAWAGKHNLWANLPKMGGVYHDDPATTPTEQLQSEAFLENLSGIEPGEGMKHYLLSGGKYFVLQVKITMAEYGKAWEEAFGLFKESGYVPDSRDHYELYVSCAGNIQDADAPWIVDLCLPLK